MSRSAKRCMTSARESDLLQKVKSVVPNLVNSMHKVIHFYIFFISASFFCLWFKGSDRLCKVVELSMHCCGKLLSDLRHIKLFKDL